MRIHAICAALVALLGVLLILAGPAAAQHDDGHDHDGEAAGAAAVGDEAGHEDGAEHGEEDAGHDAAVTLSDEDIAEFGLAFATAGPVVLARTVVVPGEIRPNADRLAHIVPRYEGIVREVRAELGDRVAAGEVLAVVESDETLSRYDLATVIPGTVIEKHLTPGEAVGRDEPAYVVADLATVWADLTIYQRDIGRVHRGQRVAIVLGHDGPAAEGEISYVSPVLDPHTRTATARVVLPNADGAWRPGMFVEGGILLDEEEVRLGVPESALHTYEGETVVFVRDAHGFEPRPVVVGRADGRGVEILAGLAAGEEYVVRGGFVIKAELLKSSFGHAGHAH
jgi:cobalt-zinc-cadmium efflux system membrane fusion protein